jgi:hypothetical protein
VGPKKSKQVQLPCQTDCLFSLTTLSAWLLCFVSATSACSSKGIFAAAINSTNLT